MLLLFYPFSDGKELLSGCPQLYQTNKSNKDVVNMNKTKLKPYGDLVNQINNQDLHSQVESDETPGAEYPNENDSEDTEVNKTQQLQT